MSVESISSFVQNLSGRAFGQTQDTQGATNASQTAPVANAVLAEDTFTLSMQDGSALTTAQAAGIFQLAPGTLTALSPNNRSRQELRLRIKMEWRCKLLPLELPRRAPHNHPSRPKLALPQMGNNKQQTRQRLPARQPPRIYSFKFRR